jgi:Family of unknown function (DUF5762)
MIWFDRPALLLDQRKMLDFWPTRRQSFDERINATSRFILYASIVAYILKRDNRIIGLGGLVLVGIYLFYKVRHVTPAAKLTPDFDVNDPLGNLAEHKEFDRERGRVALKDIFPDDYRNAERNFFTMPNNDMDAFLEYVHGGKKPFCRQDQGSCKAESNPMMMEEVHRDATTSINPRFF